LVVHEQESPSNGAMGNQDVLRKKNCHKYSLINQLERFLLEKEVVTSLSIYCLHLSQGLSDRQKDESDFPARKDFCPAAGVWSASNFQLILSGLDPAANRSLSHPKSCLYPATEQELRGWVVMAKEDRELKLVRDTSNKQF
jgi:hypothetical protein